ncbi:MAG: hypothetical protein ACOYJC_03920 [Christensenellales bacterium]|jgi:hypothetical protein
MNFLDIALIILIVGYSVFVLIRLRKKGGACGSCPYRQGCSGDEQKKQKNDVCAVRAEHARSEEHSQTK